MPFSTDRLLEAFRAAARRLVLCDYDGTLVPLRPLPEMARPGPATRALLARLAAVSEVVLVSGRARPTLEAWFGDLALSLIGEHGAWVRQRGQGWVAQAGLSAAWKPWVRAVLDLYVRRLPGTFVEEKEYTLAWHYRRADPALGPLVAKGLAAQFRSLLEASGLVLVEGNKVIEVRPAGFGKGTACQGFLARGFPFVLAIGDDTTDEDLFQALPPTAWSIRVGLCRSGARFHVPDQARARRLLEALAEPPPQESSQGEG